MSVLAKPKLKDIVLESGGHKTRADGVCVMELAAWLAGREHTAQPPCVSPAIAGFLMAWNDSMTDSDRQKLKPYAKKVLNTATNEADERTRGWMATDWLVREFTPAWLRMAGLTEHAEALEKLAPLLSTDTAKAAMTTISAADSAAYSAACSAARSAARSAACSAAYSAACSAACSAARSAADSAAYSAAYSAARSAACSAARSAARSAAYSAAYSAADSALAPTVKILQKSAFGLLDRMIAVGKSA